MTRSARSSALICIFLLRDLGNSTQHGTQRHNDRPPHYSLEDGFVGGGGPVSGHFQKRTMLQIDATDQDALEFLLCEIGPVF